jgi:hypothetical protein
MPPDLRWDTCEGAASHGYPRFSTPRARCFSALIHALVKTSRFRPGDIFHRDGDFEPHRRRPTGRWSFRLALAGVKSLIRGCGLKGRRRWLTHGRGLYQLPAAACAGIRHGRLLLVSGRRATAIRGVVLNVGRVLSHYEPALRTHFRCDVPLLNSAERVGEHFSEAPCFA